MRYCASDKAEIIQLVENSALSVRQTLARLDIHKSTFYNWLKRYEEGGINGLEDKLSIPQAVWNKITEEHREAIIDYDVAVRLAPGYPDTYLDRGNSRYALGDLVDAIKDFSEAIRLKPNWGEAYANRAVAYAEHGDQDKSERDAATARTLGVGEIRLEEMLSAARSNLEPEAT